MASTVTTTDTTQVLVFQIGTVEYCIDITSVSEIVDGGAVTPVPNSPEHVEGMMDRRGEAMTIVNPCTLLETREIDRTDLLTDGGETQNRIIVLDTTTTNAENPIGWIVSNVDAVRDLSRDFLEGQELSNADLVEGVVSTGEDGFLVWVEPTDMVV